MGKYFMAYVTYREDYISLMKRVFPFGVIPFILFLMTVVSCSTMVSYEKATDSLRRSGICCESFAQFRYDQLTEEEGVSFRLDASSDAFDFKTGKSYFKAFRLPKKDLPYSIKITSYALGEHFKKTHIFHPQITLLDDNFAIILENGLGDLPLTKAGYEETVSETWGLPIKLEGSILIDNPGAKYILIYTTQRLMSHRSPYLAMQVMPIILPGFVSAIPTGEEEILIKHSPFGLLRLEIGLPICQFGSEDDLDPDRIIARLSGRDSFLFLEAVEHEVSAMLFDAVVVLRGPDILGGTIAALIKDGCVFGHKFLSRLELIYATQILALFQTNPDLQDADHLENAAIQAIAEDGDPAAQFHMGLVYAWGRGVSADRGVSIEWLKRSGLQEFGPAMLALGMTLSGPGALIDEAEKVGKPPRTDENTDLAMAYFWLEAASHSKAPYVKEEALFQLDELAKRMSPEEIRRAKDLVKNY